MIHTIAQIALPLAMAVAAAIHGPRRRIVRRFRHSGAFDEAHAIAWPFGDRALYGWWRRRFLAAGVLRSAVDGRFFVDAPALHVYRRSRQKRAAVLVAIVLALFAIVTWRNGR